MPLYALLTLTCATPPVPAALPHQRPLASSTSDSAHRRGTTNCYADNPAASAALTRSITFHLYSQARDDSRYLRKKKNKRSLARSLLSRDTGVRLCHVDDFTPDGPRSLTCKACPGLLPPLSQRSIPSASTSHPMHSPSCEPIHTARL